MKEILDDYRCVCGKLLFRGLILTGGIEAKCRFCKKVQTIEGLTGQLSTDTRYVLFLNKKGEVVRTSSTTPNHVGFSLKELRGMHVADFVVMLAPTFYATLWDALGERGKTVMLFQTLQKNKDKSMSPVRIEAQAFVTAEDRYVVFTVEKKRTEKELGIGGTLS